MLKYEWYLFDLDGTLTESADGILNSARHALVQMGKPVPPEEEMRKFVGPPLLWSFETLAGLSEEEAHEAIGIYRERYSAVGWKENRVYPGIAQLLRGIRARGGRIALASAKPQVFCERILEEFGLSAWMDRVSAITFNDDHAEKEQIILRALPEGTDPDRVVMIGDRVYDIEGARRAGVHAVGVTYGYGVPEEFKLAETVAGSPDELWEVLIGPERDRGCFITFEGVDGSGKSTQFRMAEEQLCRNGWAVDSSREPGGCPISEKIRELLLAVKSAGMTDRCEALLFAAARAQHVEEVIRPALDRGRLVLCDRFVDSSLAYQGWGRELSEELIRQINEPAVRALKPDLTLLYAASPKTARARVAMGGTPDRIESEGEAFVRRVGEGYRILAEREPVRIRTIDAEMTIGEMHQATMDLIGALLDH